MLKCGDNEIQEFRAARFSEPKRRLILILLDASDSMEKVISSTRDAVIKILKNSYVKRDEVAIIKFQGKSADVVKRPTQNAIFADEKLHTIKVNGSTPLLAGLQRSIDFIKKNYREILFALISDGNPNISESGDEIGDSIRLAKVISSLTDRRVFINPNPGFLDFPLKIATALQAKYIEIKHDEKTGQIIEKMVNNPESQINVNFLLNQKVSRNSIRHS